MFGIYNEMKVGIEICCTTYKTEHENVQKDQESCDCIVIACPDKTTKEKVLKQLDGKIDGGGKVRVCMVSELLNNTEEIIKR